MKTKCLLTTTGIILICLATVGLIALLANEALNGGFARMIDIRLLPQGKYRAGKVTKLRDPSEDKAKTEYKTVLIPEEDIFSLGYVVVTKWSPPNGDTWTVSSRRITISEETEVYARDHLKVPSVPLAPGTYPIKDTSYSERLIASYEALKNPELGKFQVLDTMYTVTLGGNSPDDGSHSCYVRWYPGEPGDQWFVHQDGKVDVLDPHASGPAKGQ